MKQNLAEAIEQLYAVFAECPKPPGIDACPCCLDEEEVQGLLSKPLRSLTAQELSSYAASVFLTVGGEDDFRYFLPRILELSATNEFLYPDPEIVLGKLRHARWNEWRAEERQALDGFFDAVLTDKIAEFGDEIDTWLCAIAQCVADLSPYLDRVAGRPEILVGFYEVHSRHLPKGKLSNPFWHDVPDQGHQVVEWFRSESIRRIIDDHYVKAERNTGG